VGLRSRLSIPLEHIVDAYPDPSLSLGWFERLKIAGAYIPGTLAAGTFFEDGGLVFWDVEHPKNALVIELHDETYQRLVVESADPAADAGTIRAHLRSAKA
jgi:hypothetical protein